MPTTQKSKSTQSKPKKRGSKGSSLKDVADKRGGKPSSVKPTTRKSPLKRKATYKKKSTKQRKSSPSRSPKFPATTITAEGKIYELSMELTVALYPQKVVPQYPKITQMDMVMEGKQIFKAGSARITEVNVHGKVREYTKGMDAEDVELILKLFGLAEDDDKKSSSKKS